MQQMRTCMPSIARVCQPQLVEVMTNPLLADGHNLVTCAKSHSQTVGGVCELMVERMTRDGLMEKLLGCGRTFMKLCPAETLQLMGSESTGKVNWKALIAFTKCLNDPAKRKAAGATCDMFQDALSAMEQTQQAKDAEKKGGGYGWGYGRGSQNRDDDDDDDGNRKREGGIGGLIFLLCICCGLIGCGAAMGHSYAKGAELRAASMRAGHEYQQQNDMELGSPNSIATSFAPPGYAVVEQAHYDQSHGPIVTATPVSFEESATMAAMPAQLHHGK